MRSTVAWLSLDEGDNDPTRFLTYLVAAFSACVIQLAKMEQGRWLRSDPLSRPPPRRF